MKDNYLTDEEQYKEILNNEEIGRIRDWELRLIRMKYWEKRHAAFLDERHIPDWELGKVFDRLIAEEQKEIAEYRARKVLEGNEGK